MLNKKLFPYYAALVPVVFLTGMLLYTYTGRLEPFITCFFVVYVITLLYTIRCFGGMSLYAIFLYASIFFLCTNVFLTAVDAKYNFLQAKFPFWYLFEKDVGVVFLIISNIMVYSLHCAYCLIDKRTIQKRKVIETSVILEKSGRFLMLLVLFPLLYKLYIQFNYILSHGYEAIFTGKIQEIDYPIWTFGVFIIFNLGYLLFMAGRPSKNAFLVFSLLYALVVLFDSLKGQRGGIIGAIVAITYLYRKQFLNKFKIRSLIVMGAVIVVLIVGLGTVRGSYGKKTKTSASKSITGDTVFMLLAGQSGSNVVPMLIICGDLKYHPYPFIFAPLLHPLVSRIWPSVGQTDVSAQKYNDISQVAMYNVSRSHFLRGYGYGGAFLAEAYDCGGIVGVIVWSVILAYLLAFFDYTNFNVKKWLKPLLILCLFKLPLLPRNRFFGFYKDSFNLIVFVYVTMLCIHCAVRYIGVKNER